MSSIDNALSPIVKELNLTKIEETKQEKDKLGQQEFLELMVAQLRHQDPFSPMENGDFIAQMAQFSSVTGLEELNKSFSQLATSLQSNQALQASTLVGRSVFVPTNSAFVSGDKNVQGILSLPVASNNVVVTIEDDVGQVIRQIDLGEQSVGDVSFQWDGLDNNGDQVPAGRYNIAGQAQQKDGPVSLDTFINAAVESVTLSQTGQGLTLNLKDLGSVPFSQVREIK
ncbi:MAG: flagellar hook assembly protein FlgD [Gammaproteobacteria bacterium]|nr:flagellar hook assembly protein FlgD [Gammaproteobacteria bacterium]